MTKACDLSGKKVQFGNNVSKANNKTRRKFNVNLQSVTFKSDILNKSLRLNVSNSAMRSIDKKGSFDQFMKEVKSKYLSDRLKKVKKSILQKSA